MTRRFGKKLTAEIKAVIKNPDSVLSMAQKDYSALRHRVRKSQEFRDSLPIWIINGWDGKVIDYYFVKRG